MVSLGEVESDTTSSVVEEIVEAESTDEDGGESMILAPESQESCRQWMVAQDVVHRLYVLLSSVTPPGFYRYTPDARVS